MNGKVRRQAPVKGGRRFLSAGFIMELEEAIKNEQRRIKRTFGLWPSRSFVIATACGFALGVETERYDEPPDSDNRRKKGRGYRRG